VLLAITREKWSIQATKKWWVILEIPPKKWSILDKSRICIPEVCEEKREEGGSCEEKCEETYDANGWDTPVNGAGSLFCLFKYFFTNSFQCSTVTCSTRTISSTRVCGRGGFGGRRVVLGGPYIFTATIQRGQMLR
jgi:hypothetical protein